MGKPSQANKRMFYRLINHLIHKSKKNSSEIPSEYISILNKYQKTMAKSVVPKA